MRRHLGPAVELNLPRLFFKQIEIIGSTMGCYQEFAEVTEMVANGLPVIVDEIYPLTDYPDGARSPRGGQPARQDRPESLTASSAPHRPRSEGVFVHRRGRGGAVV